MEASTTPRDVPRADGIAFMAGEEKLARDVYLTLGDLWNAPIFSHIANAEQRHMDLVVQLADAHGLADPVGDDTIGVFDNDELQQLYDELITTGSESYEAALEVGAVVEEVDIEDLVNYLDGPISPDVAAVYERLVNGSENHLRAFVGRLEAVGVDRSPVVLEPGHYDGILADTARNGFGNRAGCGERGDRRNAAGRRGEGAVPEGRANGRGPGRGTGCVRNH